MSDDELTRVSRSPASPADNHQNWRLELAMVVGLRVLGTLLTLCGIDIY